ncbi:3-oxoacyl-[acyl-carrier-protein] synthase-3 [Paenibacillus cellulosilyticus]|uniref:Beta-ketoacyl-[acyl-carrier-protein] synthase III n=1 Tax=Paenibacillus cellulosilyticus TaxID=375489 RepID=A0A2V2YYY0_9BACL|nr:ketoacyl-ACP synthase III [Paenibacillus cellulosilyticus]PWW07340.1 3-oxoacyl-[acyl-carrier-protein] synthase-3 [Paenibacillus cellulosilyticus]QKS44482.1 ketoacyl-ACP synthase III [Paenibacillus cellulosilyticus]
MSSSARFRSNAKLTAIGSYVPAHKLTNADLERLVETSDEWIVQRTGISERRVSAPDQYTSDLCIEAVADLQRRYNVQLEDVDYIIVSTTTPDTPFPSVSARVQQAFNIGTCGAIDLQAACAGFAAALQNANGLLLSGAARKVLIIGADTMTKVTDYTDRTTCILFGDGAGAVLLEADDDREGDLLASYSVTTGAGGHHVYMSGLSEKIGEHALQNPGKIVQNGREVYKWAVGTVPVGIEQLLQRAGLTVADIDWFVPHSANIRIIESICERSDIPVEHTLTSLTNYGNTSSATIPLALDLAVREGKLKTGQMVLLYGFGAGLTQAGVLLRWSL